MTAFPIQVRSRQPQIVNEATTRFTYVTVCIFAVKNSPPLITQTPLFRATEAHGQFLGRDFNPLAKLLLLRTLDPHFFKHRQFPLLALTLRGTTK